MTVYKFPSRYGTPSTFKSALMGHLYRLVCEMRGYLCEYELDGVYYNMHGGKTKTRSGND